MRLTQPVETKRGFWLRGVDLNHRPLGYEPNELPDCSTPQSDDNNRAQRRQSTRERNSAHPVMNLATAVLARQASDASSTTRSVAISQNARRTSRNNRHRFLR
jgi:hypothetical protein